LPPPPICNMYLGATERHSRGWAPRPSTCHNRGEAAGGFVAGSSHFPLATLLPPVLSFVEVVGTISRGVRRQYSSLMRKSKGIYRSRATVRPHTNRGDGIEKPSDSLLPDPYSGQEVDLAYQWKWCRPNRETGHLCA
jgi:hypothetical protein